MLFYIQNLIINIIISIYFKLKKLLKSHSHFIEAPPPLSSHNWFGLSLISNLLLSLFTISNLQFLAHILPSLFLVLCPLFPISYSMSPPLPPSFLSSFLMHVPYSYYIENDIQNLKQFISLTWKTNPKVQSLQL